MKAVRAYFSSDAEPLWDTRHLTQKMFPHPRHQRRLQTGTGHERRPRGSLMPSRSDSTLVHQEFLLRKARGLAPVHGTAEVENKGRARFPQAAADTLLICLLKRGRGNVPLLWGTNHSLTRRGCMKLLPLFGDSDS